MINLPLGFFLLHTYATYLNEYNFPDILVVAVSSWIELY
jgi:hypothetical protein